MIERSPSAIPVDGEVVPLPVSPMNDFEWKKYPTIGELAAREEVIPKRLRGFFHELLMGRPEVLFIDASDQPDKYDHRVLPLLRSFIELKRKVDDLTPEELELLNQATLEFATAKPKERAPAPVERKQEVRIKDPEPIPGIDVPMGETRAYWWVR